MYMAIAKPGRFWRPLWLICAGLAATAALDLTGTWAVFADPGASFTAFDASPQAYSLPGQGLDPAQLELFAGGGQEFQQRWVVLLGIGGKWGRGPTSNAERCADCHVNNGRGHSPDADREMLASMLVRLSIPGEDEHGGPLPHPNYGDQLQSQGELGRVPAEGNATIEWQDHVEQFADGSSVLLRSPNLHFKNLSFGSLGPDVMTSVRIAPPIFGAGLLDAISEDVLLDIARRQQELGFNGRLNHVWDTQQRSLAVGRFGWKANQPNLKQQAGSAFLNDLGVTNSVFKLENCPPIQVACRRPRGMVPEQPERAFDALLLYLRALAVPARRHVDDPVVQRGEQLFAQAQCAVCHVPDMQTGNYAALVQLSQQHIHPYSDLLLHDMGEELADGRPDYAAGPRDWRTPPLWGIGLSEMVNGNAALLHDGRARNVAEAVLWHGGEARAAREAFRAMASADRAALLAFIASL
jgi:CxxC motif-containing protein (DUF1111 family)